MKIFFFTLLTFCCVLIISAQEPAYEFHEIIHYYNDSISLSNEYINERCNLDIYYPKDTSGFATIVWFHGGGLTGGNKEIPAALKEKGVAIVGVNYRLSPKVNAPAYMLQQL